VDEGVGAVTMVGFRVNVLPEDEENEDEIEVEVVANFPWPFERMEIDGVVVEVDEGADGEGKEDKEVADTVVKFLFPPSFWDCELKGMWTALAVSRISSTPSLLILACKDSRVTWVMRCKKAKRVKMINGKGNLDWNILLCEREPALRFQSDRYLQGSDLSPCFFF
jgi:hypothetical protein